MTKLYIVRHGESVANRDNRLAGNLDLPLSAIGRKQANRTAEFLRDQPLEAVYSSDLSRAMDTASIIAAKHKLPVIPKPGLREINAGVWAGMTYPEIAAQFPDEYQVWKENIGLSRCPGGESSLQVQVRVKKTIEQIIGLHPDSTICLVTHGLALRMMEAVWTHTPPEDIAHIPFAANASVTVVIYEDGSAKLVRRNYCDHLTGLTTTIRC